MCLRSWGPLIIARAFELGLKDKIIFKSQRSIENLVIIKKAFFDKTGTLTKLNNDINFILVSDRYSKEFIYQIVSELMNIPHITFVKL